MRPTRYTKADFDHSPLLVFYETTRACDLKCQHCRADAQTHCDPGELSPQQARELVDDLCRFPRRPLLVLTGRPDDAWLARWSRAEAAVPHPIDPIRLGEAVVSLLRPAA